jgi:signal transduction histidine kinase
MTHHESIEKFFQKVFLKVTFLVVLVLLFTDVLIRNSNQEIFVWFDLVALGAITISYWLMRSGKIMLSVLVFISIVLIVALCHAILISDTSMPLAVVLVSGFIVSIQLRGWVMLSMQLVSILVLIAVFVIQIGNFPGYRGYIQSEVIAASVAALTIHFLLIYSTRLLKSLYDKMNLDVTNVNNELNLKKTEIEQRNSELIKSQEELYELNHLLEATVATRTQTIVQQNEKFLSYAYANSHEVRGPIARLLGLIYLCELQTGMKIEIDYSTLFFKIKNEAVEIDKIIHKVNNELEKLHKVELTTKY